MRTIRNSIAILITLFVLNPVFSQGWECEDCPKRDIGLFDLDVWVENPLRTDSSVIGQKKYQLWTELFMVAGGVHNSLFNDDASKECLNYYDGQMSVISTLDPEDQTYQYGNNTTSLPPAAGTIDAVDYWITGVIANQESDGLTLVKIYVQASGTGETVAEAVDYFDYSVSGMENGKRITQQLLPLMAKIRDFEIRKRNEEATVAIDPDGNGATMELIPLQEKIKPGDRVPVDIKLADCDGVPLKNMKIRLYSNGGFFKPENVDTDARGIARATFNAGTNPGIFATPFEFDFRFPYTFEKNTSGGEGFMNIEPAKYDAIITISGKYEKTLNTSREDKKSGEAHRRDLGENIDASITLFLQLTETQDMPLFNQIWEYYKPVSVNITSFNYSYHDNRNSSGPEYQTDVSYTRDMNDREIKEKSSVTQVPWVLAIDNDTRKAVKIVPAGYAIHYEYLETETINSVVSSGNGPEKTTKTNRKNSEKSFALGPVGEEVPDPTIKQSDTWIQDYIKDQGIELPPGVTIPEVSNQETIKEIKPDILVSSGDGKHKFGGHGNRSIRKDLEDGYQEEKLSYTWNMTRIEKN